ncbi:hypothetical protein QYF61_007062 [Mycteria americana]|uniref:Uncharacterized protein n=1 Tax=Mycteria americana TaxID=33587 RepID=A0AAN7N7L4_MYCAM|nr:hypothetical protein QYF61_007062 [Mycteria americana]
MSTLEKVHLETSVSMDKSIPQQVHLEASVGVHEAVLEHFKASLAVDKSMAQQTRSRTPSAPLLQSGETAWKAQICLLTEKDPNEKTNIPEELLNAVIPLMCASKIPGRVKNATPVKIALKPGAQLIRKKQYAIKLEA